MRLQYLLWLAERGGESPRDLAELALTAGYADQAHMTREVAALSGVTPVQLLDRNGTKCMVSEMFNTDGKEWCRIERTADRGSVVPPNGIRPEWPSSPGFIAGRMGRPEGRTSGPKTHLERADLPAW